MISFHPFRILVAQRRDLRRCSIRPVDSGPYLLHDTLTAFLLARSAHKINLGPRLPLHRANLLLQAVEILEIRPRWKAVLRHRSRTCGQSGRVLAIILIQVGEFAQALQKPWVA